MQLLLIKMRTYDLVQGNDDKFSTHYIEFYASLGCGCGEISIGLELRRMILVGR